MSWVDELINGVIVNPEPGVIKHTFKGEATTDPFEIAQLRAGWQAGFDYWMANWYEGCCLPVFPDHIEKEHGFFKNGWAEGNRSAISKYLDRLYPGAKSLSYNPETKKYDATY